MEFNKIIVRPALLTETAVIADIHYKALSLFHPFYNVFFKSSARELLSKASAAALKRADTQFLVAELGGEVVGFIRWETIPAEGEKAVEVKTEEGAETPAQIFAIKEHLKGVWKEFGERGDKMEEVYEGVAKGQRHFYVKHIMVDPAHQRKGLGRALLSSATQLADSQNLLTFITASFEAHGLYLNCGFEDIGGVWEIDNAYWMREVLRTEQELEIKGDVEKDDLVSVYERMDNEKEWVMVRWPKKD